VRAAEALGRLGRSSGGHDGGRPPGLSAVAATLSAAARTDAFALVREAAARALAAVDTTAAKPLLEELAKKDAEPRVRETAVELLKSCN
jgi:HEAT repeat protein